MENSKGKLEKKKLKNSYIKSTFYGYGAFLQNVHCVPSSA